MISIELVRWGEKQYKVEDLQLQVCSWGGFTSSLLSFVPLQSDFWLNYWKKECEREKDKSLVGSLYYLQLPLETYEEFIELALREYDKEQTMLSELGIFVSLDTSQKIVQVVEVRLVKEKALQLLSDV